jgi:homoserine O-succinyltransferase
MPVNIPTSLPAAAILAAENIFVLNQEHACRQNIRPLQIAILNLMPAKEATEVQFLRLIGSTPIQVEPCFLTTGSYAPKNTPADYLQAFYSRFEDIKNRKFDGLIVTGAPVEHLPFEEVLYWRELREVLDWARAHVFASLFVCWGAQAALYHYHGVPKHPLDEKMFGVFPHRANYPANEILRGFDDVFYAPHSRHTTILPEDLAACPELRILSESATAGIFMVATEDNRRLFITGHIEYDRDTLKEEYLRDAKKGLPIKVPANYFPQDNPQNQPRHCWRAHGNLLYGNWINYIYQNTPHDINRISSH